MTEVLHPIDVQSKTLSEPKDSLVRNLDELLERYLNLLHDYQSLRHDLSNHLAAGHLSLAQANFSNPNRVRYGQDFYDERMQASCQIKVNAADPVFSIVDAQSSKSPALIEADDEECPASEQSEESETHTKVADSDRRSKDPLRWFGILSPLALRASQQSFKITVNESVPGLASVVAEMKEVEIEVRRARKKLGKLP